VISTADTSLDGRRWILRQRLLAQRQLIAQRLEAPPFAAGEYPRSKTINFLVRQPALTAAVLAGIATLLVGGRFFGSMTTVLTLARILRSATSGSQGRQPADNDAGSMHSTTPA
jgi:hypothetical protein